MGSLFANYKYGSCHCCDYFEPSTVTPTLPIVRRQRFVALDQTIEAGVAQSGFAVERRNPSAAWSKKGQAQLNLDARPSAGVSAGRVPMGRSALGHGPLGGGSAGLSPCRPSLKPTIDE